MSKPAPIVDRTVAKAPGMGVLGMVLVLAALGLIILGARKTAALIRGLDQGAMNQLSTEQQAAE